MDKNKIFQALIKMAVKQAREIKDDQEALELKILYKQWDKQIGRELQVGEYVQHDERLYRVLQTHIAQTNWEPGVGSESLFVVIDKVHAGTMDDPIPWNANMECENGKYYIEDEVLYLCVRDSGIALQCKITDVLGSYFQLTNVEPPIEEEVVPPIIEEEEEEKPTDEPIEEEPIGEVGTLENPIAYEVGVTPLENGKYYIENDVVYLCIRSEAVVYHALANLIGLYVNIVE